MTIHQLLSEWSQWFWPIFANHLWQATLLTIAVWIASIWLGRAGARQVFWTLAFAKLLLPSTLLFLLARGMGLSLPWPAPAETIVGADAEVLLLIAEPVAQPESDAGAGHNEAYCVLTALWLIGIALCLAGWAWRRRRSAAVALAGERVGAGREAAMLADLKNRLNVRTPVGLILCSRFAEPMVWRALRPLIVLPRGLAENLNDGELESVLAHELFHVKRYDNLFGSLQMFVCCFFWFHPLVWLIDRKLIENREVMCDERVLLSGLSGAAPDAYAASLWKVVQFGLGWPVAGISRAAGSNLNRRIKLMLNANHRSKSSMASRALAGITFVALIALAAAMALFSRDGVAEAKRPDAQDQKTVATAPAKFENLPDIPLIITDARLSAGESRVMTDGGDPNRKASPLAVRGVVARDVEFVANLVNQSDRRVTAFIVEIQNPTFWANEPVNTISNPTASGKQIIVDPQQSFRFEAKFPLQDKKGDLDLMSHLYGFNIRITGVKFESDEYWLVARPGQTPGADRVKMAFDLPTVAAVREKKKAPKSVLKEKGAADSVQPISDSLRPKILYREKAKYTEEAKNNKIEGDVLLSVVFSVDGKLSDIKVVQGLPFGLTESAIAAAKKIRFDPAVKDGRPVSVRGTLELHFRLYEDAAQPMSGSLRPTIRYRESVRYTQAARDNKIEGTVILNVVFRADGKISDIKVVQGLPDGLTENTIEAAKKIRFDPAVKDGRPVSVRGKLEFTFKLDE
ncbi:MAG TPA: M56 family metallopeptidase [Blastocatellia bacterium]|jgi:TonB family protein|nr:M56 family metallopeptidase [Blastocatellia bacterium]